MMKTRLIIFITVVFSFSFHLVDAQNWDDIGNKWIYSFLHPGGDSYYKYKVTKDTLIDNKQAVKIEQSFIRYIGVPGDMHLYQNYQVDTLIFYQSGDSIFWYNEESFQFVYSLRPNVGDKWVIDMGPNFSKACLDNNYPRIDTFEVDSFKSYTWNDGSIRNGYFISNNGYWSFSYFIIEDVGPSGNLIPLPAQNCNVRTDFTGGAYMCGSLLSGSYYVCQDFVTSTDKTTIEQEIKDVVLFPNPTQDKVFIKTSMPISIITARIVHLSGQLISEEKLTGNELDISYLPSGIYTIQLFCDDSFLTTQKIIKL